MSDPADVLFLTSGTYPYYEGGVSTWANALLTSLPEYNFKIVSLVSNPHVELQYKIPPNAKKLEMFPIWGIIRPDEFNGTPITKLLNRMYLARSRGIEDFLHSFEKFLQAVTAGGTKNNLLAESVVEMFEFLKDHDYRSVVRDKKFWELFSSFIADEKDFSEMSVRETLETCRTVVRYLEVLTIDIPRCHLIHSSIAGIVGFLGVIAKLRDGIPYILTEHGVYYRERLLHLTGKYSKAQKEFWVRFERAIAKLSYDYADLIAPVSKFNAQWETQLGADQNKIKVIHNGVDTDKFKPIPIKRLTNAPTISVVTRIDRLKGILDLIPAMTTVCKKIPEAKCLVFGSATDLEYAQLCVETRNKLGLSDSINFMGFTKDTPNAFNSGDIVALPSISEGFPFALIEGMACAKASVATDVGGVGEALGDSGIIVPPRDPVKLGEALAQLLTDTNYAQKMGAAARDRTLNEYALPRFADEYRGVYKQLNSK
ncbi:MAG TPA: GT4 family glycosyltransferase PelF [Candidatus Saccharimonadales bacterium]|nr:GT4 family glycosyltransferase PelF [Candidatus Saccharimonadales bacterium]